MSTLKPLAPADWTRLTPCPGWDVLALSLAPTRWKSRGDLVVAGWLPGDHAAARCLTRPASSTGSTNCRRPGLKVPVGSARVCCWTCSTGHRSTSSKPSRPRIHATVTANVSWASEVPVPVWLDHARELTEKWIHRQQILEALGQPSDLRADLAGPVMDALRWAYPHRLKAHAVPQGSEVEIRVDDPEIGRLWRLTFSNGAVALRARRGPRTDRLVADVGQSVLATAHEQLQRRRTRADRGQR